MFWAELLNIVNTTSVTSFLSYQAFNEASGDYSIQLDSDEEPLSLYAKTNKKDKEDNQPKSILEQFASDDTNVNEDSCKLPGWLYKYLVFRFNLLDRTGEQLNKARNATF